MPSYRLDARAVSKDILKKYSKLIEGLAIENGELRVMTTEVLPKARGVSLLPDDSTRLSGVTDITKARAVTMPVAGESDLELRRTWSVEAYSTRKADLARLPVRAGSLCLQVTLGGGRGDQVCLGAPVTVPNNANAISLRARGAFAEGDRMSLGVVLTTARERPWLELVTVDLKQGQWQLIEAALGAIDASKLQKADRVNLVITTDADDGFCQIQDMHIAVKAG